MRPHIFLATPCFGGLVSQGYMQSVIATMQAASGDGYDLSLALLGQDSLITRSRNTLVAHFMANPTATHLLFVDGDISFDSGLIGRLLSSGKQLVGASYPIKQYYWDDDSDRRIRRGEPARSAGPRYVGELFTAGDAQIEGNLAAARYVGTGFMLIQRSVIDRMIEAYPQTRYQHIHAQPSMHPDRLRAFALFDCVIDPQTQTYLSEDFAFCHRWRAIGGDVWLDIRSSLSHTGSVDFCGEPWTAFNPGQPVSRPPPREH